MFSVPPSTRGSAGGNLMPSLRISAGGMDRQLRFLEVISANIANAGTTRGADGTAYRRRIVVLRPDPSGGPGRVEIAEDPRPGRLVYEPGHPDANADGFVEYPNIDVNEELVDLMLARRIHEANAAVFQAAKGMLRRAMDI